VKLKYSDANRPDGVDSLHPGIACHITVIGVDYIEEAVPGQGYNGRRISLSTSLRIMESTIGD
jgi:hypothetical protein